MSEERVRSAIDALVDENIALRDEVDDVTAERDDAERVAAGLQAQVEQTDTARSKGGKVKIGYVDDGGTADRGDGDLDEPVSEDDAGELATIIAERDAFLADTQRLAADFANYRKQSEKRVADAAAAQSAGLVRDLLPVLDACDSAIEQDPESPVGPIRSALLGELERNGLELLAPAVDDPFEPEKHDAVMHDADPAASGGSDDGPRIAEVLRAGYIWKGRVVRPAMVKVVG